MVKEKRKPRLENAGAAAGVAKEFIGFGAFAAPIASGGNNQPSTTAAAATATTTTTRMSPVYTGSHPALQQVFQRIVQKRDGITKTKALQDLCQLFSTEETCKQKGDDDTNNIVSKWELRVHGLPHWMWIYAHKLVYETKIPSVRAAALQVWQAALQRVPKAVVSAMTTTTLEVWGMWFTSQADPMQEVRQEAVALVQLASQVWTLVNNTDSGSNNNSEGGGGGGGGGESPPWCKGVLEYSIRILGYGRSSVMYEALFAKKGASGQTQSAEQQKEEAEERFNFLVGLVLDGLALLFQNNTTTYISAADKKLFQQQQQQEAADHPTTYAVLFKCMTSPVEGLRLRTYRLVSSVASQPLTLPLIQSSTFHTLVQSLSSEKNPNAWPALLEAFLAVVVTKPKELPNSAWRKGLVKALRKACYGASVESWGPILLPLTSTLCSNSSLTSSSHDGSGSGGDDNDYALALELIKAAWEGQHVTLGMTEAGRLAAAVAETAHYILLRPPQKKQEPVSAAGQAPDQSVEIYMAIAQVWLEVLENALTDQSLATGNARRAAWEPLLQNLAKQLQRYQDQTGPNAIANNNNAFASIRNEFWSKVSWPSTHPEALAYFVTHLSLAAPSPGPQLERVARTCFHELLVPYQESSAGVPQLNVYQAIDAVVRYHPTAVVTERFVVNDLLRWIVLHTSQSASHAQALVQADFKLLASSLQAASEDKARIWWSTVLLEVIASKPNLPSLTLGIDTLMKTSASPSAQNIEWISCNVLDDFAKNIFTSTLSPSTHDQLEFCRTVLGLTTSLHRDPIVNRSVWETWITAFHDDQSGSVTSSALPQILLQMTQAPQAADLLAPVDVEKIVLQSWSQESARQSGEGAHEPIHYMETLQSSPDLSARVLEKASTEMKRQVEAGLIDSVMDWGLRAWRLVEMCSFVDPVQKPSLSLMGLDYIAGWKARPLLMNELTLSLFDSTDENGRYDLLKNTDNCCELLLEILIGISEGSTDLTIAARVSHGDDRATKFLDSVGASPRMDILGQAIHDIIPRIALSLNDKEPNTLNLVAVFTILLRFAFEDVAPTTEPVPVPSDIRAGDRLWYVKDPKSPKDAEPVSIVKVHFDSVTGYYFTIQIDRNGEKNERQTVVDRLRIVEPGSQQSTKPDEARCTGVRDQIITKLLKPYFHSASANLGLGEVLNALTSRLGLGQNRGIGSSHFELFRLLSEEEQTLRSSIETRSIPQATESLWKLSLSFGFGRNCERRDGSFRVFAVDPIPTLTALAVLYGKDPALEIISDFDRAALSWLAVAIPAVRTTEGNVDILRRVLVTALGLCEAMLLGDIKDGFKNDSILGLTAFGAIRRFLISHPSLADSQSGLLALQSAVFSAAVDLFAFEGDKEASDPTAWSKYSGLPELIEEACQTESGRAILVDAVKVSTTERLVYSLFNQSTRFYAFALIDSIFGRGKVLREEHKIHLDESTLNHLKEWTREMNPSEAQEFEEDVEVVSQWLPLSIMREVETWHEETFEDLNETKTIGRLLTWLLVIEVIETVAPKDFRGRPAFVSYLTKANVVPSVLNVSILFDETMNSSKIINSPQVFDKEHVVDSKDMMNASDLASHVIFRTFETLPSLCRRWWEEECPQVYKGRTQSLVEKQIAPEILKRELRRLTESTKNFGEMSVTGSVMSREVTATYMQDDFALKVLIRLPASFPLRSAEVDCSRTLGVPTNRWKRWSLQITLMLNNQGGTLQDALMLWKDNVDKEFDGVEPCPVCYSVLQVKTHKLPSLECATCHNRFHADCLAQWFRQSGKKQCVLCQQDWRGVRV